MGLSSLLSGGRYFWDLLRVTIFLTLLSGGSLVSGARILLLIISLN